MATANHQPAEGGGLLGLLFGVVLAVVFSWVFGPFPLLVTIILGFVLGALGWRYGDSLWFWLLERLRWFVGLS